MTKSRVLLPRAGIARGGNGPRDRRGVPCGDARSTASARRRPASTSSASASRRRSRSSSTPRCSSRRSSPRASRSSQRCASAASSRTSSSGTRSASSPRSRRPERSSTGEAIGLVRERGLAMAEAARQRPGSMAAILGLDDEEVEKLCRRIVGVWPANYNCPGQIVVSGEHEAVEECCAEAESLGARRAVIAQGVRGVPQPARRASGRPACARRSTGCVRRAALAVHVDGDGEDRARTTLAALLVDQLTAPVRFTQAATELIRTGATTFVEVGPGNVSLRVSSSASTAACKTMSVNSLDSLERAQEALSRGDAGVLLARGPTGARHRRVPGHRPRDRDRARAGGASVVLSYRTGADEAEALATEIGGSRRAGGRLRSGLGAVRSSRRRATSTSS